MTIKEETNLNFGEGRRGWYKCELTGQHASAQGFLESQDTLNGFRAALDILFLNEKGAECFKKHHDTEAVGATLDPTAESGVRWYLEFELDEGNAAQARSIKFHVTELKTNNIIAEAAENAADAAKDVANAVMDKVL